MKFINQLTASFVGLGLIATVVAQNNQAPKFKLPDAAAATSPTAPAAPASPAVAAPAAPAVPTVKYSQAQLMEAYGIMLAARANMVELEYTASDVDAMAHGMKMLLAGEKPTYLNEGPAVNQQLSELMAQKQEVLYNKVKAANIAAGNAYFANAKSNSAIKFSDSGLGIETLKAGTGATPKLGQQVKFHFTLYSLGNEPLSSSIGQTPLEWIVREGEMFPGMLEGLQKITVGSKSKFYIPYKLAAGEDGAQGMPPAASLIFEIELLEVKDAPKDAPAAAPAK